MSLFPHFFVILPSLIWTHPIYTMSVGGSRKYGNVRERWSIMIESGCRTGKEFTTAWEILQKETEEYAMNC